MRTQTLLAFLSLAALAGLAGPALGQSSTNNSLVRFRITYANDVRSFVADLDVELFDSDKPVTVSNFLAYVEGGRYDNSILHRLEPNRILQGGDVRIANPYSAAPFERAYAVDSFGSITNEFFTGTIHSNVFGTLAMALRQGDANSASSSWFFNLATNSDLDSDSGGPQGQGPFTVFGRVKLKAGEDTLKVFNTLSLNHGIIDTTAPVYDALGCPPVVFYPDGDTNRFNELPVAFTDRQDCVRYRDLFKIQVIVLRGPDIVGPRITVASPRPDASIGSNTVTVSGTAVDNKGVAGVRAYLGTNAVTATGSNSWSVTLVGLSPGTNVINVEATDTSGNRTQTSLSVFYSVPLPLSLEVVGAGQVTGATNGQLLELTRRYPLVARPSRGNLFVAWTGSVVSAGAKLNLLMESNTTVTAVFRTNLFPAIKGTYSGIFYDTNQVEQESSGFVTLTLTDQGAYSGRLLWNGRNVRWSGVFAPDGGGTNEVTLVGAFGVKLLLRADLTGGTDQIVGLVTNQGWTAQLTLDRAVFQGSGTNVAPFAGSYTLIFPRDTNATVGPAGEGFASVRMDKRGRTALTGALGDGSRLGMTAQVSKAGLLPFYVSPYQGLGVMIGWFQFDTNQAATDFSGLVNWFKQRIISQPYNPLGFTNEMTALGSRYLAPTTNRVIALTNTTVGFTNGNLPANFANEITLESNNRVTAGNSNTNNLTLTLTRSTGLFSGRVTPPYLTRPLTFKGAILQKQNRGSGLLYGTSRTSQVELGP